MLRAILLTVLAAFPLAASAATCTWNVASGNWSAAANWANCADAPGPSTRAPGAADVAVLVNGTANLDVSPTVAEFELGSAGILSVVGATKSFDVANALRFNGGQATTILGTNQLLLKLHAGGSGSLLAPTALKNAVFFENSGTLTLGSASGVALTLVCCAEVRNMPGGTITFSGGNSLLYFDGGGTLLNNAGATLAIAGNTTFARPTATANFGLIHNDGTMTVTGPGTLDMPLGGGIFEQFGDLTIANATITCSFASGNPNKCSYRDTNNVSLAGVAVTHFAGGTLDLGGTGVNFILGPGSTLTGNGTLKADLGLYGTLAPGALNGTPYGTLAITGKLIVQPPGRLDFDLGGSAAGQHDAISVGGSLQSGGSTVFAGYGRLTLRLAAGYLPALGDAVAVMSYASVLAGSAFNRVDANYGLDYAARFDATALQVFPAPRVTVDGASVVEGNSGTTEMTFNVHLSQPSAQTITLQLVPHEGTAVSGLAPSGDWLFPGSATVTFTPGQVLQTQVYEVNGDAVVEADESFALELYRNKVVNAALGNGVPGDPFAVGTILTDDLPANTHFVLVGKDNGTASRKIRRYTTSGTFIDSWDDGMPSNTQNAIVTGLCFAPDGRILATRFGWTGPILYSRFGATLDPNYGLHAGASASFALHESCVFDSAGNAYIGNAGGNGASDSAVAIRKLDRNGDFVESFTVPTGTRGTDWIDLAGDQCTIYYTSEDTSVRRYNVCTHTALGVFANGLTGPFCYALRLRPNRELMVACQDAVHRLDSKGVNLHTYPRLEIGETDANGLFAMNLDPDGTSFWTAGLLSGNVFHVDIESGTVLGSFNSGSGGVAGLLVYDELHDDTIFLDDFDGTPPASPIVFGASLTADAESETQFEPDLGTAMPAFVPTWMRVIAHEQLERERER